jgi:hypothetical protein
MKWIITFLVVVTCTIACEKSPMQTQDKSVAAAKGETEPTLAGKWKMTEFWSDLGNGTGSWMPAGETIETVTFGADGSFSSSENSPFYSFGYDRYAVKTTNMVFLFNSKSGSGDSYQFAIESGGTLLLYAKCRENCMRRYVKQ